MKTDTLFYDLFRLFPEFIFELTHQAAAEGYHFSSVEVKQKNFRIDGILLAQQDASDKVIYFVEVHFYLDPDFYADLFAEIFVYLRQKHPKSDWRALAVFGWRSLDPGIGAHYLGLADRVTTVYLDELEDEEGQELSIAAQLLRLIVASNEEAIESGKGLFRRLMVYPFLRMTREEIQKMFQINDIRESLVYQEALQEGRQEGEIKGKLEGKLEAVPVLMRTGMSVKQIAQELGLEAKVVRKVAIHGGKLPQPPSS